MSQQESRMEYQPRDPSAPLSLIQSPAVEEVAQIIRLRLRSARSVQFGAYTWADALEENFMEGWTLPARVAADLHWTQPTYVLSPLDLSRAFNLAQGKRAE